MDEYTRAVINAIFDILERLIYSNASNYSEALDRQMNDLAEMLATPPKGE